MGSLEDLFEREEIAWHSYDDIVNYLSGDGKRKRLSYQNAAIVLAEPTTIVEEFEKTDDFDKLRELRMRSRSIRMPKARDKLLRDIGNKMEIVGEELAEIKEERVEERLIEEREIREREAISKRVESIEVDIDSIEDLRDLDNVKGRIKRLAKKEVEVVELEERVEEIRLGLEAQREAEREEKTRVMVEQQEIAKLKKEELRAEGVEPDF